MTRQKPRLCDLLLSRKGTTPDEKRRNDLLRRSEKFLFERQTVGIDALLKDLPQEAISEFVPWFRTPYSLCWFENDWSGDFDDAPDVKPLRDGVLVQTDNTNLRGLFWYVVQAVGQVIRPIPFPITFDFTADWPATDGGLSDLIEQFTGVKTGFTRPPTTLPPFVEGPFLDRFSFCSSISDRKKASDLMGRLMKGQRLGHMLLSCLMSFHIPKERVLITRDDFGDYNKSRRRLGLQRQQRAEMHVVKIHMTQEEFDEEAEKIMERFRSEQNDREYTPRGEHRVRDHDRTLRSGRVVRVREHRRGNGPVKSPRSHYETDPLPQRLVAAYLQHLQQ